MSPALIRARWSPANPKPDEGAVAKILRDQGLIPTSIEVGSGRAKAEPREPKGRRGRVKIEDIVVMSRQFATMIRAGLPLMEVLNILAEQSDKNVSRSS
jgi:type IV pilus assembly protein PilC